MLTIRKSGGTNGQMQGSIGITLKNSGYDWKIYTEGDALVFARVEEIGGAPVVIQKITP